MKIERIIWVALLASICMYVYIAFLVGQRNAGLPFEQSLHHQMVVPLYAIGAVTFGMAFFIRSLFRGPGKPRRLYNIVGWALFESVTIYGLVLALLLADWRLIVAPALLTILGFALTFPSEEPL